MRIQNYGSAEIPQVYRPSHDFQLLDQVDDNQLIAVGMRALDNVRARTERKLYKNVGTHLPDCTRLAMSLLVAVDLEDRLPWLGAAAVPFYLGVRLAGTGGQNATLRNECKMLRETTQTLERLRQQGLSTAPAPQVRQKILDLCIESAQRPMRNDATTRLMRAGLFTSASALSFYYGHDGTGAVCGAFAGVFLANAWRVLHALNYRASNASPLADRRLTTGLEYMAPATAHTRSWVGDECTLVSIGNVGLTASFTMEMVAYALILVGAWGSSENHDQLSDPRLLILVMTLWIGAVGSYHLVIRPDALQRALGEYPDAEQTPLLQDIV